MAIRIPSAGGRIRPLTEVRRDDAAVKAPILFYSLPEGGSPHSGQGSTKGRAARRTDRAIASWSSLIRAESSGTGLVTRSRSKLTDRTREIHEHFRVRKCGVGRGDSHAECVLATSSTASTLSRGVDES